MIENIWYVSASSKAGSFTSDPKYAVKDLTGTPVVAPGHMKMMVRKAAKDRADSQIRELVRQVWEELLDEMEDLVRQEEDGRIPSASTYGRIEAFQKAIAIMEYGYEYRKKPRAAIERVQQEATVRYNESTGDW